MKFRKDFVTNSSSSSYICDITGNVESGFNIAPDEVGMCQCNKGHTFLEEFATERYTVAYIKKSVLEQCTTVKNSCNKNFSSYVRVLDEIDHIKKVLNDFDDAGDPYDLEDALENALVYYTSLDNFYDGIPNYRCPICHFEYITQIDALRYLKKEHGITINDVKKEMLRKFKSFDELQEYLKDVKPGDVS